MLSSCQSIRMSSAEMTGIAVLQPKIIHVNSVTDIVENVNFMHAPEERFMSAKIPIKVRHGHLYSHEK